MAYVMGTSQREKSLEKDIQQKDYFPPNTIPKNEDYLINNYNLIQTAQSIAAPFGSSSIKPTLNPSKPSNAPGPGSYSHSNKNTKTILNSNRFFITNETRFKSSDNHIPGVGEYNINIYNNKFNTPKKMSSYNFKPINLHNFILYEKIQTLPNKYPLYNYVDIKKYNDEDKDKKIYNNIFYLKKHNNAIDWQKVSKKTLENESNTDNKKIPNDFIMLTEFNLVKNKNEDKTIINNKNNNNEPKQVIYKNNLLGFKDNFDSSSITLTSDAFKNKEKKEDVEPGPGQYEPINENFKCEPKKNKFQNFGTYESRNLNPIPLNKSLNKVNTENTLNNFRFKKRINDSRNKLNKYKRLLHNLRINIIKEQSKQYKQNVKDSLGPGSYSPYFLLDFKRLNIKNLSKTINVANKEDKKPSFINIDNNPGVGEYDLSGEFKKIIEHNLALQKSQKQKEVDELKLVREKFKKNNKKKEIRIIRIDYADTEEYKLRKQFMHNNIFRPPFNSAVPKFKSEKKNDINITPSEDNIYYPKKEFNRKNIPFMSGAKRASNEIIDIKRAKQVGPGSYEQKSFFDWNKKSFNVQYKLK